MSEFTREELKKLIEDNPQMDIVGVLYTGRNMALRTVLELKGVKKQKEKNKEKENNNKNKRNYCGNRNGYSF
jgi:Holliday junction resolvasome RuvABC DNA-binding subunit